MSDVTDRPLPQIEDDFMRQMLLKSKNYCLLVLRPGPNRHTPEADAIIWEHGRRNFALREAGLLSIVCPVGADAVAGIGIFNCTEDEARELMTGDPSVQEGVLVYEVYSCRGFPGDSLPD